MNSSVTARFNESKHQMVVASDADGVPLPDITGTRFGVLFKDTSSSFNQVSLKSRYFELINEIRDGNILNEIGAGDYDPNTHLMASSTRDGEVTYTTLAAGAWWAGAPDDSVSVALPVNAGWTREGATIYLDNIAKRVFEKIREDGLVFV